MQAESLIKTEKNRGPEILQTFFAGYATHESLHSVQPLPQIPRERIKRNKERGISKSRARSVEIFQKAAVNGGINIR